MICLHAILSTANLDVLSSQGVVCFNSEKNINSLETLQYIQLSSTRSSQSKLLKH